LSITLFENEPDDQVQPQNDQTIDPKQLSPLPCREDSTVKAVFLLFLVLAVAYTASAQDTLKIMTWNLLNYVDASRDDYYRTVIRYARPDALVVEEMTSQAMVDNFYSNVVDAVFPGKFSRGTFIDGPDTDNEIYYKSAGFTFIANTPIQTALRDISEFKLYNPTADDTIRLYAVHLKASSGSSNESLRAAEVEKLRSVTDVLPNGKYFLVAGDFNIYGSSEPAYQELIQDNPSDYGNFIDPITLPGTWNILSYAPFHTESTRTRSFGDGATGGLDDRFDMILFSTAVSQPGKVHYLPGSLTAIGNDGRHYNDSINKLPNFAVPDSVANALELASDHLPVSEEFVFSSGVEAIHEPDRPLQYSLEPNFPNPFNPTTTIRYTLPHPAHVTISLYNTLGQHVSTLVSEENEPGEHSVIFDGTNFAGGVYFYRLQAGTFVQTRRFLLVR
jgi:hypothetical protein